MNSYGTAVVSDARLAEIISETFDLRPRAIIERLNLLHPGFEKTAAYGHFGRDEFSWEQLDYVDALKEAVAQLA